MRIRLISSVLMILISCGVAMSHPFSFTAQNGGDEGMSLASPSSAGLPGGSFFPGHDPDHIIINLTGNPYGDNQPFPNGYYMKYAGFNSNGTRIALAARNQIGGVSQPYEIWVMDYSGVSQTVSNFQRITSTGGIGDIAENTMSVWSKSNPDLLMFLEVHVSTGNVLKTYNISSGIFSTVYDSNLDPTVADCGNEDFLGASNTSILFGDYMGTGESDIFSFHGAYNATKITTDTDYPTERVDVSCDFGGTRIIYYSGSALYSPGCDIGGIVFADYSGGVWWENSVGFGDPNIVGEIPGYWAAFSGRPNNKILASMMSDCWSGNSLGLYDQTGNLISNLVGSPGTDWKWCFGWQDWEGTSSEILFRAEEYTHAGYGNNLFIALTRPSETWVEDDWDGPSNCGGHAWGYDAYDNIGDAIEVVLDGGTVNVAAGTYPEQVVISKSLILSGSGNPVIQDPAGPLATYRIQESSAMFEPMVFAYGGSDDGSGYISGPGTIEVTISGFDIDGNNSGTVNRFTGILIRNCQSSLVSYNSIYEMLYSSGLPQTSGILIYGNSNIQVDHNVVNDWTRGGIIANGDNGSLTDPTAAITDNTVVGEGQLPPGNWAQNGIQIGYGATGSIVGNEISDIWILDPDWSASGIVLYYPVGSITVGGNNVHECQGALNAYFVDDLVLNSGNIFDSNDFVFIWGGDGAAISGNTFSNNAYGFYISDATNASIQQNSISGNQYGIIADGACSNLLFSSNNIIGSTVTGALIQPYGPSPTGVVFQENNISGNLFGIDNITTNMINGLSNWWGDESGPNAAIVSGQTLSPARPALPDAFEGELSRPEIDRAPAPASRGGNSPNDRIALLGAGDPVSALVDYSPWWGANYIGDPHSTPWRWGVNTSNASTIQEAIDLAAPGDVVQVFPGTYHESIAIDKSLVIKGDRGDSTVAGPGLLAPVLDGTGFSGLSAFSIGQGLSNVTIEGLEIRNYGPDGNTNADAFVAWNSGTSDVIIRDNFLHHLGYAGVLIGNGWGGPQGLHDSWQVSRNVISNFGAYAVDLENAQNSLIFGNEISSPTFSTIQAIMVLVLADPGNSVFSSNITISANTLVNFPDRAINFVTWAQGATSSASLQNLTVSNNVISGGFTAINDWKLGAGTNSINNLAVSDNNIVVNNPKAAGYAMDVFDVGGLVVLSGNSVSLTGALQPGATFFHGLNIGGAATGSISIDNSNFDGNAIGASNVGIRLRSTVPATANINIADCNISEFGRGIRSDALAAGTVVNVDHTGFTNNTEFGISNGSGAAITAHHDWWDSYCGPFHATTNPDGGGNAVSDNVVYDPWCEPSFARCDFSNSVAPATVWVDDDYTPLGANDGHYWCYDAFDNIQEGIEKVADGGAVNVMAGIYVAQIVIDKPLSLIGNGAPVIECPAGVLVSYTIQESGARFEPMIFAYGGFDDGSGYISGPGTIEVTISGFDIDGNNSGTVNRFTGILIRNCQSSLVSYNSIYEMLYSSGLPQTSGILIYGNSNIQVDHNVVNDWTRGGIIANGDNGSLTDPTAAITNNTVVGEGVLPQGSWAQNGVQIGFGASGSVIGNEVSDIWILDPDWSASGLVLYDALPGTVLRRNNVHECQAAINAYYSDDVVVDSSIFANNDFAYFLEASGISVEENSFTGNGEAIYLGDVTNSEISNNALAGNEVGIAADGASDNIQFDNNRITGNTVAGIVIQPYGASPSNITIARNCIENNAFGIENTTANMVHAAGNWWGDINGPSVTAIESGNIQIGRPIGCSASDIPGDLPARIGSKEKLSHSVDRAAKAIQNGNDQIPHLLLAGDQISSLVDYSPWWGADYQNDPHSSAWHWYLNTSNSSSIQEALDLASEADSIFVLPGTYAGPGNRNIDFGGKDVVLQSTEGAERTIIDCESAGRGFRFHGEETSAAIVNGFTIKNGATTGNGGAILCENEGGPVIAYCLIINNQANGNGGAIYCSNSAPSLTNNTVYGNKAVGDGGGIYVAYSSPMIINTIFWQDSASAGNEIFLSTGAPSITYSDIQGGWPGDGNLDCDPRFCEPDSGDFHLSDISCCAHGGFEGGFVGAFGMGCVGDFLPGDANANGVVNGVDVIYMVNYFKDIGPPFAPPIWRADANGNCLINGVDAVYLINYLKGFGPPPLKGDCVVASSNPGSRELDSRGKGDK